MTLAKRLIEAGDTLYIISARQDKEAMMRRAEELGISRDRVFATGSNRAKIEKIKSLAIQKHYDNNADVIEYLPATIGEKFSRVKKVIFDEDFNEDKVKEYKDLGYKVYIRSERKIKKKDKKVWNKLQSVGLTEDHLVFGEVKDLHKKYDFDLLLTGQDPLLEALKLSGTTKAPKQIIKSEPVYSLSEAKEVEQRLLSEVKLKFVTVKVLYTYEETPGLPPAKSGSRPFCKTMLSQKRFYTLEEISQLPNEHLREMFKNYSLEPDVFQYRGGFYRLPGTLNTTPWCRHFWKANVVVV
jgi:hypothetical protein